MPNANNPRLLQRLVGLVAAGIRKPAGLAEILDVELRTVHYYTQAAEWLGLVATDKEVHLTARGMELAFSEPTQRARVYAEAVWSKEFARKLLTGRGTVPEADVIAAEIRSLDPEMSPSTARRRASAVRSLLEPALGHRPSNQDSPGNQLALSFPAADGPTFSPPIEPVDPTSGPHDNPEIYARVFSALLDHGELSTGNLRAILDRMGAKDASLGDYMDMALRRGDAHRLDDHLVVSPMATQRRDLAQDDVLIALSDPDYRSHLDRLLGDDGSPCRSTPRQASWDRRLFGKTLTAANARSTIEGVLVGRRLEGLPSAGPSGDPVERGTAPFLDSLDRPGLAVAFPSSLTLLCGGLEGINGFLQRLRARPGGVHLPGPLDSPLAVHGGLLHPGETPPRAIPDLLTLRLSALTRIPALALCAAILLADRRGQAPMRITLGTERPELRWRGSSMGGLLDALGCFCEHQGWTCSRTSRGGLDDDTLLAILTNLGVATRTAGHLVMAEALFVRLQEEPEARLVYEGLMPLRDRIHAWLEEREAPSTPPSEQK
ncbi:MAG: hypothetical protein QGG40_02660 [Myxococcota bacterium]|nr:hypothetical protein [Myxococcota bacterium]